jgi:hypothetical protein
VCSSSRVGLLLHFECVLLGSLPHPAGDWPSHSISDLSDGPILTSGLPTIRELWLSNRSAMLAAGQVTAWTLSSALSMRWYELDYRLRRPLDGYAAVKQRKVLAVLPQGCQIAVVWTGRIT